jgi:protein ImuB
MELESPVETIESLAFVLNRLLEQLCTRLEARALAAQELRLRLQLEPRVADEQTTTLDELNGAHSHTVAQRTIFERTMRLPVAMRDAKVFLKLLQLDLATHPPGAPVIKLWISAEPAPPRSAQRGLFLPISPEPEKLEITLARINAVVGERRAGIARLLDTHRRGAFQIARFAASEARTAGSSTTSDNQVLAMRMIRPARQLKVRFCQGRPEAVLPQPNEELQGAVLWAAGPWRSSGDWWTENKDGEHCGPWDREEWDVALADGAQQVALYRIYRDFGTGRWFADASYD